MLFQVFEGWVTKRATFTRVAGIRNPESGIKNDDRKIHLCNF